MGRKYLSSVIKSFGYTRLMRWLPFYEELRLRIRWRKNTEVQTLLDWAERNVHPPYDE
jgi:hypothetical protein